MSQLRITLSALFVAATIAPIFPSRAAADQITFATAWGIPAVRLSEAGDDGITIPSSVGIQKFKPTWGTLTSATKDLIGTGDYDWEFDIREADPFLVREVQFGVSITVDGITDTIDPVSVPNGDQGSGSVELSVEESSTFINLNSVIGFGVYTIDLSQWLKANVGWDIDGDADVDGDDALLGGTLPGSIDGTYSGFAFLTYIYTPASPPVPGDADLDGDVDGDDYNAWALHFPSVSNGAWNWGDFDSDGDVDGDDYNIWANNFPYPAPPGGGSAPSALPEPASLGLLAVGALVMMHRRSKRGQ